MRSPLCKGRTEVNNHPFVAFDEKGGPFRRKDRPSTRFACHLWVPVDRYGLPDA